MFDRYIAYQARLRPYEAAVSTLQGDVSYARFDADVTRFAQAFGELDPASDAPVVVRLEDPYLHWVVVLAMARLGVPTASVGRSAPAELIAYLKPRLLVSDGPAAPHAVIADVPTFQVSAEWVRETLAAPRAPSASRPAPDPARLGRVLTSSGTTGMPKKIGLSWREIEQRLPRIVSLAPRATMRLLALSTIEAGGFGALLGVWHAGGTVVFGPRTAAETALALPRLRPFGLAGAPIQLQGLLDALPTGFLPQPELSVHLFGSRTPAPLKRELGRRLSANLFNVYGSTEGGLIAAAPAALLLDEEAVGFVAPWTRMRIVDDAGDPVAAGETGHVRIQGPDCAAGYLDDDAATAQAFRQGWFHPGDLGSIGDDGLFRLAGRSTEVMDLGGEKVLPRLLEDAALACAGVVDAAAFTAPGPGGVARPWVAVVRGEGLDQDALARAFALPSVPPVHVAWIDRIPRNARGKIERDTLRDAVLQSQPPA